MTILSFHLHLLLGEYLFYLRFYLPTKKDLTTYDKINEKCETPIALLHLHPLLPRRRVHRVVHEVRGRDCTQADKKSESV